MNLRPSGYEPDELPTAPPPDIVKVPKTGLEPVREDMSRRILSPVLVPVPPLRLILSSFLVKDKYYINIFIFLVKDKYYINIFI